MKTLIFAALLLLLIFPMPSDAKAPFGAYWLPEVARNLPDDFVFFEGCVRPLKIEKGRVYFLYSISLFDGRMTEVFDFPENQLIKDPRKTGRWMERVWKEKPTLWDAIEDCAGTWRMPDVTRKIFNDMVRSGIVAKHKVKRLTSARIMKMMVRYTALVSWDIYRKRSPGKTAFSSARKRFFRVMHSPAEGGVAIMTSEV